ncbi:MAG: DUF2341 domain-containing protein [Deltaproteobacteria bacterium]|nr:DUF2341 domain-containing protein [Deltaproteobacteria bacterium]
MKCAGLLVLLVGCGFSAPATNSATDGGADAPPDVPAGPSSPRKVVFSTTGITTNLDDFPVLIPIAGQVDYARISDPRTDLRFVDPVSGNTLAYEVELWDPLGESLVWVRVPRIGPPPTSASILMHFGPNEGDDNPTGVWAAYEQVNHFAGGALDSSGNGHDGLSTGAHIASGYLGSAAAFTTNSDRIVFSGATLDQWTAGSIEMWIRPGYANAAALIATQPRVLDNGGSLGLGRFFDDAGALAFQIDVRWSGTISFLHPALVGNAWSHVAWSYDNNTLRVYRNGEQVLMDNVGARTFSNSTALVLGDAVTAARMHIDELRISRAGLSLDWIRAQHLAMSRNFVSFTDP